MSRVSECAEVARLGFIAYTPVNKAETTSFTFCLTALPVSPVACLNLVVVVDPVLYLQG
jgi:hypothetical protein